MANPIGKAYKALDDLVMKGVNEGVRTWNWTTGETKTELANKMLTVSSILFPTGILNNLGPLGGGILGSVWILANHVTQKENTELEDLESKAVENNMKNAFVEDLKVHKEINGSIMLAFSPVYLLHWKEQGYFMKDTVLSSYFIGSGMVLHGISEYVMRSDYFPPQKNCISRGVDKLKKFYEDYKAAPANPQLSPILNPILSGKELEY